MSASTMSHGLCTEAGFPSTAAVGNICPGCTAAVESAPVEIFRRYRLFHCSACELQFWQPLRMPDAEWHEDIYSSRDASIPPLEPGHRFFLSDPLAPRGGRLLDVGCGVGNFLAAARNAGYDVTGIELNTHAVRTARERLGLPHVYPLRPHEFLEQFPESTFDVITFFEVLEHQDDPDTFVRLLQSRLSPRGYMTLSVPNRRRWQTGREVLDYPPNHLTRWDAEAVARFFSARGFEVLSIREEPLGLARAVTVLSMALQTGLVGNMLGQNSVSFSDLAELPAAERAATLKKNSRPSRQAVAAALSRVKSLALYPIAAGLLPVFRAQGRKGGYLYALLRRLD